MVRPQNEQTIRRRLIGACLAGPLVFAGCAELPGIPAQSVESLMQEGQRLLQAGRHDEALAVFQKVAAIDPLYWQAYLGMARCWIAKLSWPNAVASARKAYELAPKGQDVVTVFADALLGGGREALTAGRYKDAIGLLFDYIKIQPTNGRAYLELGKALIAEKRFADALQTLMKGLGLASGADRSDFLRELLDGGAQAFSAGQFRDAIGFFTEYVKLDPARVRSYIDLAKSYLQSGAFGEALSTLMRGLAQATGTERQEVLSGMLDAGRQALTSGKAREAVGFLREYIRNDRGNLQAYIDLGKAYWQSNERLNALDAFRRALELDPRNSEALNFLRGGR
jgi:tetratricopeptide (TPR) repeat protein